MLQENDHCAKPPRGIQFFAVVFLIVAGVALLFCSMYIPPHGEIHPSVLTAFGMMLVFAGSTLGIDYNYKTKFYNFVSYNKTKRKSKQA